MAICPFAVQQIIPESYTQGRITPTTLIYHRAVSSAESLRNYWNTPGVELESHFHIGQFGTLYQFMDTNVRADANVDANGFAISVESWDGGDTPDSMPWNPAQLATAKRLAAWVCETHGVKRAAAQTWNGGGIGGHNWFPDPWADGPRGCPGTARNAQIRNDIIPYVANSGGWQEEEMNGSQEAKLDKVLALAQETRNRSASMHTKGYLEVRSDEPRAMGGDLGWFQNQMRIALAPVLTALAAATNDPDITADQVRQIVDDATAKASREQAVLVSASIKADLLPLIDDALGRVQDADNADEARRTAIEFFNIIKNVAVPDTSEQAAPANPTT